jgi:hypothetical protein
MLSLHQQAIGCCPVQDVTKITEDAADSPDGIVANDLQLVKLLFPLISWQR